ncbi:MAG: hypothetical protein ACI94Y_002366 [Maribacter sp.]|jgi:hypothetical protein
MKHTILTIFLMTILFSLTAQLPKTQIFSFDYTEFKKKKWKIYNPKLLTNDNKVGYNNQPSFIGDDLYITQSSSFQGQDQTDIVALDITNKTKSQVTKTASSEYSPTAHPDGKHFTVIKAHTNGDQILMKYQLDKEGKGKALFSKLNNVGYHCWLSADKVALFLVDESKGHRLVIGEVSTGKTKHVAFNVGRCLKTSKSGNLIYLDKEIEGSWKLKTIKSDTGQTILLGDSMPKEEDFEVLPDGYIVAGHNGSIYKLVPEKGSVWIAVANLKFYVKDKKISRIASKGNRLVVVAE